MVLLVNQHSVPIFVDVANAFAESNEKVILFTGHIEPGNVQLHPSIKVKWSKSYQRKSSFTRIVSWLMFSAHYGLYLLTVRKPDKILVVTNPPLAPMVTACMARVRKMNYSILLYDLYPEALFQAGFSSTTNKLYKIWSKINPWAFAGAEKIFTLSESMKKAASVYLTGHESKLTVIYNWADTSYISPRDKKDNPFVAQFQLQHKVVVLYSGNMGLTHDLESVLEAAEELKEDKRIIFVLIGEGGKKQKLQQMKERQRLSNVLLLPYQNAEMFPFAMAAGDIGIVTLGRGAEGISVPSKTYVAMAAGLCVVAIAPEDSELVRIIKEYKIGIAVPPGKSKELVDQLLLLVGNREKVNAYKKAARSSSFLFSPDNALLYVKEMSDH